MASRDPKDLHPEVAKRWQLSKAKFAADNPDLPQPFLTQTYRSPAEQDILYAQGRTKPGKIVTNAKGGQSVHNYMPSCAFDIAFKAGKVIHWEIALFKKFATVAKSFGLEWGGDWKTFQDNPHYQAPNYTWQDAKAGKDRVFESDAAETSS